ncbi:hypothetical protein GHL01_00515 [Sinorhizobium meliloti]|uniref:hypothetical protein n=1 Tax=Rhizobium meliloti TaxID=382 RepID=UPI0012952371|nr:hypothetical protein [Sinorhizobium meliloti]MQV12228.1 hypothetical protein [Sinorhizobium meliloti]
MKLENLLANETSAAVIFGRIHAREDELAFRLVSYDHATADELDDLILIKTFFRMLARPNVLATDEQQVANNDARTTLDLAWRSRGGHNISNAAGVGNVLACRVMGITESGGYDVYDQLTARTECKRAAA